MSLRYHYLTGRPVHELRVMFAYSKLVNTHEHIEYYRYMDGKDPVLFKRDTVNGIIEVSQPGVCLFDKFYYENTWEQL